MIIFALDTTSEFGSLALRVDGRTRAEETIHSRDGFAHLIFPVIANLMRDNSVQLSEVDCFASASGPGAFTGVRVGLAAVKGLAEALSRPALGVSNLRAMATFGSGSHRAVLLDARRGDIFGAVYDNELHLVAPEVVMKIEAWMDSLTGNGYEFITPPDFVFPSIWEQSRFAGMPVRQASRYLASAIAECAEIEGLAGTWMDPALLDANYVRRSDAELFWKDC